MPLFSPDQTGLKPAAQPEPEATPAPAPRKRRAKTTETPPETEQPVADQPDDPNVG